MPNDDVVCAAQKAAVACVTLVPEGNHVGESAAPEGSYTRTWYGPAKHAGPQLPAVQTPPEHDVAQVPQWALVVLRLVSQPSDAMPLQSPKPALQVKPHVPEEHVGVALAGVGHTLPQMPQLVRDVLRLVSQPLLATRSQSAYGDTHTNAQVPAAHTGVPLEAAGQVCAHDPQLDGSLDSLTHAPEHTARGAPHEATHDPAEHT